MIPVREARDLLLAAGCSSRVIRHSEAVLRVAGEYADRIDEADRDLVMAGALLHDIGRSRTHSIWHAQDGAGLCRQMGIPEPVALIVERHIGAGLGADECTLLRLIPRDCIPISLEERIVANADNLVRESSRITIDERLLLSGHLPAGIRRRIYHLWLWLEQFPH
jgi:uncharacterized protein